MYNNNLRTKRASHLYHIQPIGIGTPYVESLTSYMKRLAEAHCVSLGILIGKEIIPDINKDYLKLYSFLNGRRNTINSMSSATTESIVMILNEKTCNYNLNYLTMNIWKDCLSSKDIFRKKHAWCPICYEESLQSKYPIYEQLIWNFNDIDICKKHQIKLIDKCPHCNSEFINFRLKSRIGYCNNCNSWLGLKEYENIQPTIINAEWYSWVYDNIGQLLMATPIIREVSNLCFSRNIANLIKCYNISIRSFANKINVSRNRIMDWLSGSKPLINDVLYISYKFGCSVYDILTKDIDVTNINFYDEEVVAIKRCYITTKPDMKKLKETIDEAIVYNRVLSLKRLSIEFKIHNPTIKKYFSEEVIKLKEISDKYIEECKIAKFKLIKDTMKSLLIRGIFPSRKALSRELGKRVVINDDERKVWFETLEELGCKYEDFYNSSKK